MGMSKEDSTSIKGRSIAEAGEKGKGKKGSNKKVALAGEKDRKRKIPSKKKRMEIL